MATRIEFNTNAVVSRFEGITEKAQKALDIQVLKDSNYFCPHAEGTLKDSAVIASGGGKVIWNESYAHYQYTTENNKATDKNPNASMEWFERAKALWEKDWIKLVQSFFKG